MKDVTIAYHTSSNFVSNSNTRNCKKISWLNKEVVEVKNLWELGKAPRVYYKESENPNGKVLTYSPEDSIYKKDQGGFKEKKIDRKMRREGDRGRETGLGEGEGRENTGKTEGERALGDNKNAVNEGLQLLKYRRHV
ncbi:hypothetical protein JHK85_055814 [Glycine max]|nr:hypothetical protein JHK85_055814 [Glycine max]